MDDGRIVVDGMAINVYTASQVGDVLDEARRLERTKHIGRTLLDRVVIKLDSLNYGRMDS